MHSPRKKKKRRRHQYSIAELLVCDVTMRAISGEYGYRSPLEIIEAAQNVAIHYDEYDVVTDIYIRRHSLIKLVYGLWGRHTA